MLPASFQTPAAIILLVGGLLSCFAGYRVFRFVLAFFGFVFGALAASSAMGADQTLWMIGGAIVGGLVGALILVLAYFVGVALIGAGIGAGAAMAIWAALGREPGIVPVLILSVLGALAALALQRYVIIVSTAFGGAQTAIVGGAALLGGRAAAPGGTQRVSCVPARSAPGDELGSGGVVRAGHARRHRPAGGDGQGEKVDRDRARDPGLGIRNSCVPRRSCGRDAGSEGGDWAESRTREQRFVPAAPKLRDARGAKAGASDVRKPKGIRPSGNQQIGDS